MESFLSTIFMMCIRTLEKKASEGDLDRELVQVNNLTTASTEERVLISQSNRKIKTSQFCEMKASQTRNIYKDGQYSDYHS